MGTNYYHRKNTCEHCKRYDETHIGKSSAGWTFTFHATESIKSYQDWLIELEKGGKIFDEYNREVTLDEFKDMVKYKSVETNNHATYCKNDKYDNSFLDDEGNSFINGEFS